MGRLFYSTIMSLDGYIADASGGFEWAAPDAEVHQFVNDLERGVGTYLYGRRMYETMVYWQTAGGEPDDPEVVVDFAEIWRAADKVVFSRTLEAATTPRTRIERNFDAGAVRALKANAAADLSVGGAGLAGEALRAGLVDELQLFVVPHLAGGGTRALPEAVDGPLSLLAERRFAAGTVFLRYALSPRPA